MSLCNRPEWIEYNSWCGSHNLPASWSGFLNWLKTHGIVVKGALLKAIIDHKRDSDITIKSWETKKEGGIGLVTK